MMQVVKLSFKEMINKRIFALGIAISAAYLLIYGIGLHYLAAEGVMGGDRDWLFQQVGYQIFSLGWYISTFMVGTLAILVGAGSISRELETGTILALASKPLSRINILTGKFCAYSLMLILYSLILLASISLMAGYYFNLFIHPLNLLQGSVIFCLFPLLLLAVSQLFSACFSTMAAGAMSFMLFAAAIIGGFIEQMGALVHNTGMVNVGIVSSLLLPTDAVYRMAIYYTAGLPGSGAIYEFGPFGASSVPSGWMLIYAIIYIVVLFCLGLYAFAKKDF